MISRLKRIMRSPTFPSFDRKDLWVQRTRDLALNDFDKAVIEGEINVMTDEEVTAALVSSAEKEDVEDFLIMVPAMGPEPVTVTDDNSDDENIEEDDDPTNRYSIPHTQIPLGSIHPRHDFQSQLCITLIALFNPFHDIMTCRRHIFWNSFEGLQSFSWLFWAQNMIKLKLGEKEPNNQHTK